MYGNEKMIDATGKVATYRANSGIPDKSTGHCEPPKNPHPDEMLRVRWSGYFIPSSNRHPVAETIAYYAAHPDAEGHPVSGDELARTQHTQCGDPDPDQTYRCRGPQYCQAAPHEGGTGWLSDRIPRYRDIAHVLYPGGVAPEPWAKPAPDEPKQLDLLDYLEGVS
ncbi:MAG: hypothetical protein DI630_18170 [Gordonia sp. (in: high G+C Gram-positive bacteria)]|nr:MAG: hypothetical protein DI630_18170 [Gordonia sp. (in: high G+C Gram-positive bacteria)]